MKKLLSLMLPVFLICTQASAEYTDHRNHNVDSLETVMAGWTAMDLQNASEQELKTVASNLEELMSGFNQTNGVKSEYYARMLLGIARRHDWPRKVQSAAKNIGQHFWAKEQYDSAAFYYGVAMKSVEEMAGRYDLDDVDDALSQMYGTLGNLYSMMDSIDVAMEYYEKAGELFKKHDWYNSCSVLYYNMGETMRYEGELESARGYYDESLRYSLLADDSLAVATAYKGLGSLYMEMHRTSKAMRCLDRANSYFADHEDEELQYRMESLDYTSQVLALQKKRLLVIIILMVVLVMMAVLTYCMSRRLKKTAQENKELAAVLEDAVDTISTSSSKDDIHLKPRELEVLSLIAKGYTNAEVAEAVCLSPETVKWYKKKLFATFEASNSAELVRIATERGLI